MGGIASGNSVVLGDSVTNSAGILQLGNAALPLNQTLSSLIAVGTGSSRVVGGNAGNSTLTMDITGPVTFPVTLGGGGTNQNNLTLAVTGGGVMTLTGPNTYTGGTVVTGGSVLAIASDSDAPAPLGTPPAAPDVNITLDSGTLQFTAPTTLEANRTILVYNESTIDTQDNAVAFAGTITGGATLHKAGTGTFTYTGATSGGPVTLLENQGTIVIGTGGNFATTGFSSIGVVDGDVATMDVQSNGQLSFNGDFNVADLSGSIGMLNIGDTAAVSGVTLYVGKNGNAQGYVTQTGGSFNQTGGGDTRIGGGTTQGTDSAAVGVYTISGGSFTTAGNLQVGAFGSGEMNISGTATATVNGGFPSIGRFIGGFGVLDVNGGSFTQSDPGGLLIIGEQGTGVLNVRGGATVVADSATNGGSAANALSIGHTNTGNGTVNLIDGTLTVLSVGTAGGPPATSTLNFNGGTLQAAGNNLTFVHGLTNAYVYGGGATIDTNGSNVTISQSLLAPPGAGVSAIPIASGNGGAGYAAAPIVQINGDGTGATAVATMAGGVVTGITITNPGVNYTTASATLIGGNPTTAASPDAATTAANTSGGLTKINAGVLTLSGLNTYGGPTRIQGGTLRLATQSPGLYEGIVANGTNGFDTTDPIPQTYQVPTIRLANSTASQQTYPSGIPDNSTVGYTGYFNNSTGAPEDVTFTENFDDSVLLTVDGNTVLNDGDYATQTSGTVTLAPGLNAIELRLGQGGGGVGPTAGGVNGTTNLGVAYSLDGGTTYLPIADPGDGSLLVTGATPSLPSTSAVIMSSDTTFDMTDATATIGSLSDAVVGSTTGHQVLLGSGSLTTGTDNTDTVFSGAIHGTGGSLTKVGTGQFTLAGTSDYTGPTTVNNGTLRVTGSLTGAGAVTVGDQAAGHATLSGTGSIAGSVHIVGPGDSGAGATIAGASGTTLSLSGGLMLDSGTVSSFAITPEGVGNTRRVGCGDRRVERSDRRRSEHDRFQRRGGGRQV